MKIEGLIPHYPGSLEPTKTGFMVPSDSLHRGTAYYMGGADTSIEDGALGLALTIGSLLLCNRIGPVWGLILSDIDKVQLRPMKGVSMPIRTEAGVTQMTLRSDYVVEVSYRLNYMEGQLFLGMMTTPNAQRWHKDIEDARRSFERYMGEIGHEG